jgi:hypothetical protein
MLEPLSMVQGLMGLRTWLSEVQYLMGKLKQRSFSGVPLNMRERQVLQWYSARWRELRGGAVGRALRKDEKAMLMTVRYGPPRGADRLDLPG